MATSVTETAQNDLSSLCAVPCTRHNKVVPDHNWAPSVFHSKYGVLVFETSNFSVCENAREDVRKLHCYLISPKDILLETVCFVNMFQSSCLQFLF